MVLGGMVPRSGASRERPGNVQGTSRGRRSDGVRQIGSGSFGWAGLAGEVDHGALEGASEVVEGDAEALGLFLEAELDELLEAIGREGGEGAIGAREVGE